MNIPENCDFPECLCPGPERCEKGKKSGTKQTIVIEAKASKPVHPRKTIAERYELWSFGSLL